MSRYDSDRTLDEAVLIAAYHDEVDSILEAYARSSRACTADRPARGEA